MAVSIVFQAIYIAFFAIEFAVADYVSLSKRSCPSPNICGELNMEKICMQAVSKFEDNVTYEPGSQTQSSGLNDSDGLATLHCLAVYECIVPQAHPPWNGFELKQQFSNIFNATPTACTGDIVPLAGCGAAGISNNVCSVMFVACYNCILEDSLGGTLDGSSPTTTLPLILPTAEPTSSSSISTYTSSSSMTSLEQSPTSFLVESTTSTTGPTTMISPASSTSSLSASVSASTTVVPLPIAVSSAVSGAQYAQTQVSAYVSDPSSSTGAQSAKDAVDSALSDAQLALGLASDMALITSLVALTAALTQASSAAALAVTMLSADAAAALSAAMAVVASATVEVSDLGDTPSVTPTSSMISTQVSSSTTVSSTTSSCTVCANCDPEAEPSDPPDPFPGYIQQQGSNSTVKLRRIRHRALLQKRAASREVQICGQTFSVPTYNSWTGNGVNSYSDYFRFEYQRNCQTGIGKYDFFLDMSGARPVRGYASEHIYEVQLINQFVTWMKTNSQFGEQICDILAPLVLPTWLQSFPGQVAPIKAIISSLSGGDDHSDELVYLDSDLNRLKAIMFGGKNPRTLRPLSTNLEAQVKQLASISIVFDYLNEMKVAQYYKAVSSRMRSQYALLDQVVGMGGSATADFADIGWVDSYNTWEKQFLGGIQERYSNRVSGDLEAVKSYLDSLPQPTDADKALKMEILDRINEGWFSPKATINLSVLMG